MAERMWGASAWRQEGVSEACSHLDSSKNREKLDRKQQRVP